jgi:hypothetical protein
MARYFTDLEDGTGRGKDGKVRGRFWKGKK